MAKENTVYEFKAGKSIGPDTRRKTKLMAPNGQQIKAGDIIDVEGFNFSPALIARYIKEKRFIPTDAKPTVTVRGAVAPLEAEAPAVTLKSGPSAAWTKDEIIDFLRANGEEFSTNTNKAELLELAVAVAEEGGAE